MKCCWCASSFSCRQEHRKPQRAFMMLLICTAKQGINLVWESVGGDMFQTCTRALANGGRLVVIGKSAGIRSMVCRCQHGRHKVHIVECFAFCTGVIQPYALLRSNPVCIPAVLILSCYASYFCCICHLVCKCMELFSHMLASWAVW